MTENLTLLWNLDRAACALSPKDRRDFLSEENARVLCRRVYIVAGVIVYTMCVNIIVYSKRKLLLSGLTRDTSPDSNGNEPLFESAIVVM